MCFSCERIETCRRRLRAGAPIHPRSFATCSRPARALAAQSETRTRGITVIAYDPGLTPGTGLARSRPFLTRIAWRLMGTPLRVLVPQINSREAAGGALADLALGKAYPPAGRVYAALRRGQIIWPDPSELARRNDVMEAL